MQTSSNTELNFDTSALSQCAMLNHDCRVLISRVLPAPSPAGIAEMVRRSFGRDQDFLSSSGIVSHGMQDMHPVHNYFEIQFPERAVHIAKLVCAPFSEHELVLSNAIRNHAPGDLIILESLDLSTGHCFPYHSAFGQFQEILGLYQMAIDHPTTNEALNRLSRAAASASMIQMGVPTKLEGDQRALPALILERIRPCVAKANMISMDEFDTVEAELNRIGQDPQVSIRSFTVNRILYPIK